jgi:hypothetical protein
LSINTSSPFTLTTNNNVPLGFTETVCIDCHNGNVEKLYDNFVVTQSPINCSEVLSEAASPLEDQTFVYGSSPITTTFGTGWTSFF